MITQKDIIFIRHLRQSARKNLTSIAKATHIPVSTLFDRLKRLEKSVILRHTSLLDFSNLGYDTRAAIMIKVHKKDRKRLAEFLEKNEHINTVYKITNGFDFHIEAIFKKFGEMESFIEMMEDQFSILKKNAFYIIEEIKREDFMANVDIPLLQADTEASKTPG